MNISTIVEDTNKTSSYNFFETDFAKNAKANLTTEQREHYEKIGNYMYKDDLFDSSDPQSGQFRTPVDDALVYIEEGLNSGLNPSNLDKDEIILLESEYGKEWYKRWKYQESDLENSD